MSGSVNFQNVKNAALAAYPGLLYEWLPDGRVDGYEFKARNPTRNDGKVGSFSINIDSGNWGDFAVSGAQGGDPIDLYSYLFGVSSIDAAKELSSKLGLTSDPEKARDIQKRYEQTKEKKKKPTLTPILPVPATAPRSLPKHPKLGQPSARWLYRNAAGNPLGFVCRFEMEDGGKETLPLTYCKHEDGSERWRWKGFPTPRPLYGLDKLEQNPKAVVLLVEGEKSADAANRLFPDMVGMTWPGGAKAVKNIDWTPLANRRVIKWPDADEAGIEAAEEIAELLSKYIAISPPADVEKGWDVADAEKQGWTIEKAKSWLKDKVKEARAPSPEPTPDPEAMPDIPDYNDDYQNHAQNMDFTPRDEEEQFRILGYNRGSYYYLPSTSAQVVELTPSAHTKLNLLQLAPLFYWETRYPKKGGADWDMAANALINRAHQQGVFRPHERRRGRGAWQDNGQAVLHLGNKLVVDGHSMNPIEYQTDFTYEGDSPLPIEAIHPATNAEAIELVRICQSIRWDNPLSAMCLAGWCVIAPICGVLQWRPHIWVTGPAGSGKTTVIRDVIGTVVGPTALQVESKTTEAGIRSELGYDARPVIFDEAEAEDERSAQRMQGNLDLARVASSESGGVMYKGSATGKSVAYRVRSCFCFSSINTSVQHYADETRVTLLVLSPIKPVTEQERLDIEVHYKELMTKIHTHLTPEFASKLIMRSMANLAVLQENIATFTYAASVTLGNRRIGDQIGPMLAGAYLCHSTKAISMEEAIKWIKRHDFADHATLSGRGDEERLLQRIVETRIRVFGGNGSNYERTIGELIGALVETTDDIVSGEIAASTLRRSGIRVEPPLSDIDAQGGVYISTTSEAMKRILKGTQWASNWRRPLLSITGARAAKGSIRFTPALSTPAVVLPISIFSK